MLVMFFLQVVESHLPVPYCGYVIQESSTVTGATDAEVATFFSPTTVTLGNKNRQKL